MKMTKGRKKQISKIRDKNKRDNPDLSDEEIDQISEKEFHKKNAIKNKKKQEKKRANARKRNAKRSSDYSTTSGKSVRTVSGGGVSPR